MATRVSTFLLCGLTMIIFILMFYYLTCSSQVISLRQTTEELEERLRSLTQTEMQNQKRLESLSHDQHELEDQAHLAELKLNERETLVAQLKSQIKTQSKQIKTLEETNLALEESINNYKNLSSDLNAKKLVIENLERTLHENNKTGNEQLMRMKRDLNDYQSKLNETQISSVQLEKQFNQTFTSFLLKYHQLEIAYNASIVAEAKTAAELAWLRTTTTTQSTIAVQAKILVADSVNSNATKLGKRSAQFED